MNKEGFVETCAAMRRAAAELAETAGEERNKLLSLAGQSIKEHTKDIITANKADVEAEQERGTKQSLLDRLSLDEKKIDTMLTSLSSIVLQKDPIGEGISWRAPNGMTIRRQAVPLGVVSIIYESRPNVTLDAFALCMKSGNAVLLRGSSAAYRSNIAIVKAIKEGLKQCGKEDAIALMEPHEDHSDVNMILQAVGLIDVVVPRGGRALIQNVVRNAKIPAIETGSGICHQYVDESADLNMAANIALNAKTSRAGVCNAIECILVHKGILQDFLPLLAKAFQDKVEIRADEECYSVLHSLALSPCSLVPIAEGDYDTEFLDLVCAVHAVDSLDEAIDFINEHGTGHSECIVTETRRNARLFQQRVDAACVYVNASTRFTDGGEFGFGAELGISTQKLHARGPMGAAALTTVKYLIDGDGQVRL